MYRKNTGGQYLGFAMVTTSGVADTAATVTVRVVIDNGSQVAGGGSVTNMGNGQYRYTLAQADTNGNNISVLFTASGDVPAEKTFVTTAADPTDGTAFGLVRLDASVGSRMSLFTLPSNFSAFSINSLGQVVTVTNLDKADYALTAIANTAVADAVLDRDMSLGTDSGSTTVRTMRQALRFLRNKWSLVSGTLTVTKEDDATTSWTATATQSAGNPVSQIDPAGP